MARKVVAKLKLMIPAGKATPAPPLGPTLAQYQINIMEFVKQYNERTKERVGMIIPAEITIYSDKSFTFELKTPPTSELLKKAAGVEKGSPEPNRIKIGKITRKQLEEIAKTKLPDLNTKDMEKAMRVVEGTARSMGIEILD